MDTGSRSHTICVNYLTTPRVTAGRHCGDVKTVIAVIDEIGRVQRRTGNSAIVVHGV